MVELIKNDGMHGGHTSPQESVSRLLDQQDCGKENKYPAKAVQQNAAVIFPSDRGCTYEHTGIDKI